MQNINGQTNISKKADSIRVLLETAEDTAKIRLLNSLSKQLLDNNELASSDSAARAALRLADKINFIKYKGDSYNKIGLVHVTKTNNDSARFYYLKALDEDKRIHNKVGYVKHLNNIGITYLVQGDYNKAESYYKTALRFAELFI